MQSATRRWAEERALRDSHEKHPLDVAQLCRLGDVQSLQDKLAAAIETYQAAIARDPNNRRAHYRLARVLNRSGHTMQAREHLMRVLEDHPCNAELLYEYSRLFRFHEDDPRVDDIKRVLENTTTTSTDRQLAHLCLAKVYDDLGRHEEALQQAQVGKATGQSPSRIRLKRVKHKLKAATENHYPPLQLTSSSRPGPILLVGPSRSGKSLLEDLIQNVSNGWHRSYESNCLEQSLLLAREEAHPGDHQLAPISQSTAISMREHFERLSHDLEANQNRLLCARGSNIFYTGITLQAFPDSRVILCRRGTLDNAVRMYFRLYESQFPLGQKLSDAARYVVLMRQMAEHWRDVFPDQTLVVDYEELVVKPRVVLKRVLDFCGANVREGAKWPNFHHDEIGGWKSYEAQLRKELGSKFVDTHAQRQPGADGSAVDNDWATAI